MSTNISEVAMEPGEAISECIQARDKYASLDSATTQLGTFCTADTLPLSCYPLLPLITVDGVEGQLAFPLPPSQCRELIQVAQRAPFGRGERTIVDVTVRNTWQIDPSAVRLDTAFLDDIRRVVVPKVCSELGVSLSAAASARRNRVEARLYKLLVYEQGGFFLPHRDSEKDDGMFGTLVVLLPGKYTGGELVVQHAGQTEVIDCREGDGWRQFSYAAFYADCRHEVKAVLSGYRVALTFNLCMLPAVAKEAGDDEKADESASAALATNSSALTSPLPSATLLFDAPLVVRQFAAAVRGWCEQVAEGNQDQDAYVLVLEHEYTQHSLSPANLKNHDRALSLLTDKAIAFAHSELQPSSTSPTSSLPSQPPAVISLLCLFSVRSRGYEGCGDNEWEEEEIKVQHIAPPEPSAASNHLSPLFTSLLANCTPTLDYHDLLYSKPGFSWAQEVVDEEEEEGYTGNEGTNIDRFYHRAGILLLPWATRWDFIDRHCKMDVALTLLQKAAADSPSVDLVECMRLVRAFIPSLAKTPSLRPTMLNTLLALHDAAAEQNAGRSAPSAHMEQLGSLMDDVFAKRAFDFSDFRTPSQLDAMVSARGEQTREVLVAAFKRGLTGSTPAARKSPLSLLDAAKFLLRLFLHAIQPVSASASSDVQPPTGDPLQALMDGLPHSADSALMPARWVETASEMGAVLCSELMSEDRLKQTSELLSLPVLAETTTITLLLFALHCAQSAGTGVHAAELADLMVCAAAQLCQFVSERVESEWSRAPQVVESALINPLLLLIDLLVQQPTPEQADSTDSPQVSLLAAILPLPQQLLACVLAQLAALASGGWSYPADLTKLFPDTSHFAGPSRFDNSDSCTCEECEHLHDFLVSATKRTVEFRMCGESRKHIERRIASLCTPHIEHITDKSRGIPHTLRVSKRKSLLTALDDKRAALQALIDRLSSSVASINSRLEDSHTADPASASSTDAFSSPAATQSPLQPAAPQHRTDKDGAVSQSTHKRKHEVVELDLSDDEDEQRQSNKENQPT